MSARATAFVEQRVASELADVLRSQADLNTRVGRAIEAQLLTYDHIDAELTDIRDTIAALANRVESLTRAVNVRAQAGQTNGYVVSVLGAAFLLVVLGVAAFALTVDALQ